MKQFDFSVVMAVYNVENYIREAVDSLVHQSIGFSHIQLIMVDDGSTDSSGKICDEYQKKYPENVLVIHKENGRQASARNAGLPFAKGKYVNFMDPDDTLDRHAMKKVRKFMDQHSETDICCIPIVFFGEQKGPHLLNDKFRNGTSVINLLEEKYSNCKLMSASSSFYRNEAAKTMVFDTELFHAEDAKENMKLLIVKPVIGLVADTRYNYRKEGGSTLSISTHKKESYIPYLNHFSLWALREAENKFGYVPKFVQNTVMYDLQWKWSISHIPHNTLNDSELDKFKTELTMITSKLDDDIILSQNNISAELKGYILNKKYGAFKKPTLKRMIPKKQSATGIRKGDFVLCFDGHKSVKVSEMETTLEMISFDHNNNCMIEGYHQFYGLNDIEVRPIVIVDGKVLYAEVIERPQKVLFSLEERISEPTGFRCMIPLSDNNATIRFGVEIDGLIIYRRKLEYGKFFPVTNIYQNSYAIIGRRQITVKRDFIKISPVPGIFTLCKQESLLISELWEKDLLGGRKAIAGRLFYHICIPFKRKSLWIVSDRIMKADDNGEALFRYLMKNRPENTDVIFAINKQSVDYERMTKVGRCVSAMSFEHKLLHLLCDLVVSSHADGVTRNPYLGHDDGLRDILSHQKYVFLQHGITKDDISAWLNRYNQKIDGLITAAESECSSILSGNYYYNKEQIWLTGFPRYDRLYHDERKIITAMPTWRRYLMKASDTKTGVWTLPDDFEDSNFYWFWNGLVNSNRLLSVLSEYGYTLQLLPHPTIQPHIRRFHKDSRVNFLSMDYSYRKAYAESNLVITDYSSAVFDFAYLRKPIIYAQFDQEEFFAGEHVYTKGYFDYIRDGFGEVTTSLDDTIDLIIDYVKNGCVMKEKYLNRANQFFAFDDKDNCKRVVDQINNLLSE